MRSSKIVHRILKNRMTCWPAAAAIGLVLCGVNASRAAEPDSGGLDVVQVRPNFYMIAGAGGNIGVQFGVDGVVLVDAGSGGTSGQVLAAIQKLTRLPIRYIINTGADADHVGGNGKLAKAGLTIFTNALGGCDLSQRHEERRRGVDSRA